MSAAAALHSDHLNFLIYRYLQEFGHEKTARAFHHDWHRPVEHDDPESFPFAHAVQRNDLVSVIQDGLHHDALLSRIRKCERRFRWTNYEARESAERQDGLMENGAGSRPPSRTRRKPRMPAHIRATDDFATPASKRQRRSEASEAQVNGDRDPMDVDAASASADAEDDNDVISPTAASEAEAVDSVVRYDSMEIGTQTNRIETTTLHWKIDLPGAHIVQCVWNPSSDPSKVRCLLAVGESLCRFYQLPSSVGNETQEITHTNEPSLPPDALVSLTAWRPDGSAASCAIDGAKKLPDGSNMSSQWLFEYSLDSGSRPFQPGPLLLEPPGIVLQLRYSPGGEYLLQARNNTKRGSIQVWKTSKASAEPLHVPREPVAWCVFEQPVHDACWVADDTFLVCGADGLSSIYQMADLDRNVKDEPSAAAVKPYNGVTERALGVAGEKDEFEKLCVDRRHGVAVFSSTNSKRLIVTSKITTVDKTEPPNLVLDLPGHPTEMCFQPWHSSDTQMANTDDKLSPSYLAITFDDTDCVVYAISQSPEGGIQCHEMASLKLADGPALSLSWSPSGRYLAIAGADIVQVWHSDALKKKNGIRHVAEALATWRRPGEANGHPNGVHGEEQTMSPPEPSLSWSADGENLAFARDQEIAVIRFRPPLNQRNGQTAQLNGTPTP